MDARDTLKYTIGVDVVAEMLDLMPVIYQKLILQNYMP